MNLSAAELYAKIPSWFALERLGEIDKKKTAVGIFPGGGSEVESNPRLSEVNWWLYSPIVFVTGTRGDPEVTDEQAARLLKRPGQQLTALHNQGLVPDLNTPGQMEWLTQMLLKQPQMDTVILSTADYHLRRCVLTFIKTWSRLGGGRNLRIGYLGTSDPTPSGIATTSQTKEGEIERIAIYQAKGDIATAEEAWDFQQRSF